MRNREPTNDKKFDWNKLWERIKTVGLAIFVLIFIGSMIYGIFTPEKVICTDIGNFTYTSNLGTLMDTCTSRCRVDNSYYNQTCLDKCYDFIKGIASDVK